MEIRVRKETVPKMLELSKKHILGNLKREELEALLEHEDYKLEFERYNEAGGPRGGFTKEEFVDFFMNFFSLDLGSIKNERLKLRYNDLKYFFDNIDFYEKQAEKLNIITEDFVHSALKYTLNGLPDSVTLDKVEFIFSLGMGNSLGWFYKNSSHFDIAHFLKDFDEEVIKHTMAHEIHHVGIEIFFDKFQIEQNATPEELVYLIIAGEGLAVKYCNNAEGVLSKKMYGNEPANIGLDKYSWEYLNSEFYNGLKDLKQQIKSIRNNELENFQEYLVNYWFSLHTKDQAKTDYPKLKHSINYSLGNDLWGLIQDVYGKEKVFDTLKSLRQFPEVINSAFNKIGRKDLML